MLPNSELNRDCNLIVWIHGCLLFLIVDLFAGVVSLYANLSSSMIQITMLMLEGAFLGAEGFILVLELLREACR